jgi:hypothetical protein
MTLDAHQLCIITNINKRNNHLKSLKTKTPRHTTLEIQDLNAFL